MPCGPANDKMCISFHICPVKILPRLTFILSSPSGGEGEGEGEAVMKKYEILPHTADARLRVCGKELGSLFENAAYGLKELLGLDTAESSDTEAIELEAGEAESLLIQWLNELLYRVQNKHFALSEVSVSQCDGKKLKAEIKGKCCSRKIRLAREIKAATYHNLAIKQNPGGTFQTEIVFDL